MPEDPILIQAGAIWGNANTIEAMATLLESQAVSLRRVAADIKAADTALKDLALAPKDEPPA